MVGGCRVSLHLIDYMSSHTVEKLRHFKNSDSSFTEEHKFKKQGELVNVPVLKTTEKAFF